MQIPPGYQLNSAIVKLLQEIERLKVKFDLLPQHKHLEKYYRQKSILKSAVYSARIEGNPRSLDEISLASLKNSTEKTKVELANLYRALEFILNQSWQKDVTSSDLQQIHKLVLNNLSSEAGQFRTQPSAIFNVAGVAIYLCPPPQQLKLLLHQWLEFVNQVNDQIIPVKALLAHFAFEKTHPFLDGNGRVGRLLVHLILKKHNWDLRGLVAFEQYLEQHRTSYYDLLGLNPKNITAFVEFFLTGLRQALGQALKICRRTQKITPEEILPPRRYEILQIIRDHQSTSFDFIRRRFMAVSDRLLRYDLKKLQDAGFIKKRGVTKGAIYEPLASNPD